MSLVPAKVKRCTARDYPWIYSYVAYEHDQVSIVASAYFVVFSRFEEGGRDALFQSWGFILVSA